MVMPVDGAQTGAIWRERVGRRLLKLERKLDPLQLKNLERRLKKLEAEYDKLWHFKHDHERRRTTCIKCRGKKK